MNALLTAFALLLTSAAPEEPLPVYPGARHTRIGGALEVGGEVYRLAYFVTPDPLKRVARYFAATLRQRGYPITLDGDFLAQGVVSAFGTREGLIRSVVVRAHGGKTVGFSVLKDAWSFTPARPSSAPEGALLSEELTSRDGRQRSLLVERPLEDLRRELSQALAGEGYVLVRESGEGDTRRVLEHARGGDRVLTILVALDRTLTGAHQAYVPASLDPIGARP